MDVGVTSIGSVHYVALDRANGIVPKDGYSSRNKFFVILGWDDQGNAYGGVVFNSRVNLKLPYNIQLYHYPIRKSAYSFLTHDSFIDCTSLMRVCGSQLTSATFRGALSQEHLEYVLGAVRESGTIPAIKLRMYGIIP